MKKTIGVLLSIAILSQMFISFTVFAEWTEYPLTWDGNPTTLSNIANNTGYDLVDSNGNYKPMYAYYAQQLWDNGLFLGSNNSFDLDKPITRVEGVVMVLRLLGKEEEAKEAQLMGSFTDVPDWARAQVAYAARFGITSGYSETIFGSDDYLSATQYITFVLRAMGYVDNIDFTWDKACDKALEIGLIGAPCYEQYTHSNLFLRDNVTVISCNALFTAPSKSGGKLIDTISVPGKPSGQTPYATQRDKEAGITPDVEDSRLKSLLLTTESVMNLVSQYQKGLKPQSSGYNVIGYNQNGTIMSYSGIFSTILFDYSQPTIMRYEYIYDDKLKNPEYSEMREYREQLSQGTYDYINDPCAVGGYFFDNGSTALSNLEAFKKITNNNAVTQEIFDSIKTNMSATHGSNAVIFYGRDENGVAYGKYILLNIAGYNSDLDTGCPFYNLNPSDSAFGTKTSVILSEK